MPRSITIKKDIAPILINKRTSSYRLESTDRLQVEVILKYKGKLSYLKNIPIEFYLNFTDTFIKYVDTLTNADGTVIINFPCYNIRDIDTCAGYVKATIDSIEYTSNMVRFNFMRGVSLIPGIVLNPTEIMVYTDSLIIYED